MLRLLVSLRRYLERVIFLEPIASICSQYLSQYYGHLQWEQWHKGSPEWFDHRIDLYRWRDHLNPHWVERGIYSKEVMFKGCQVLDLACGDGFYAKYFYVSTGAALVHGIDINAKAIAHARKYHGAPQISYFQLDAVKDAFPRSDYDVICFDGAIDHFSSDQLDILLPKIKHALGKEGVLTGYQELGFREPNTEHPISFRTRGDLVALFSPYFKFIGTLTTHTPGRINCYFQCSDQATKIGHSRCH